MTTVGYGDMTYVPFWDSGPTNHAMEQVQRSRDQKRVKTCLVFASENCAAAYQQFLLLHPDDFLHPMHYIQGRRNVF